MLVGSSVHRSVNEYKNVAFQCWSQSVTIRRAANVVYTVLVFAQTASEFHADLTDTPYDIVFISSTYKNKLWLETDCPNIKRYDNLLDFCKCACCLPFYGTGSTVALVENLV